VRRSTFGRTLRHSWDIPWIRSGAHDISHNVAGLSNSSG
jgi:hypothetical protein